MYQCPLSESSCLPCLQILSCRCPRWANVLPRCFRFLSKECSENVLGLNEFFVCVAVVSGRMILGEEVSVVVFSRAPVDAELFLEGSVAQPMEAHVHGFGFFGLDRVVDTGLSCCVVCLDWCLRLLVSEFG